MFAKNTLIQDEVNQFSKLSDQWWNETGPFAPLHRLNPTRIEFIKNTICQYLNKPFNGTPLKNLRILDIGCGGGLVAEPLTRLGAQVTGLDPSPQNIQAAQEHANLMGLEVNYVTGSVENFMASPFDIVLGLEVLEHIDNIDLFLESARKLLKPKGVMILSTLNRTVSSFVGGIIVAERILKWLPKGTHEWDRFLKPSELDHFLKKSGLKLIELQGLGFHLLRREWVLQPNLNINYFAVATHLEKGL
ncbi:MAG: bifunctional 2-polyprenyl-6-hydroxyphenol methylase/3-demethylubiquinol 3-O-methyltransferase UbiG [Alphaproteobacteria bacterium]